MQLHQRGVDLLVNVLDSADRVEQLSHDEMRRLLTEVGEVMGLILERDAEIALQQEQKYSARQLRSDRRSIEKTPLIDAL